MTKKQIKEVTDGLHLIARNTGADIYELLEILEETDVISKKDADDIIANL